MFKTLSKLLSASLLLTTACVIPSPDGGDDTGPGPGPGPGPSGAWRVIPLIDDGDAYRTDNDLVTGIHFTAPDRGFVVTTGDNQTGADGGAVFTASDTAITGVAFSGKDGGPSLDGGVDFVGIDTTPTGFVALAYAADIVTGDAAGNFTIAKNGSLGGIERVTAFRTTSTGTLLVRDTGVVSTSPSAPSPTARYTDVWAPNATAPIPSPVPANMCQLGPWGNGVPTLRYSSYISPDKSLVAYVATPQHMPQVCISKDGGRSFFPSILPGLSEDALDSTPSGIHFTSNTNGIVWWSSATSSGAYLYRTTDGGTTWTSVAYPAAVANHSMKLNAAFFAPDGQHGWLAGFDHDDSAPLLLATADGGATWTVDPVKDTGTALYAGFALDATHIWVGGKYGLLMARN